VSASVIEGALALNVLHFARVLRAAGIPVGTAAVLDALRALTVIDVTRREDFRACLRAVLVHRHEHEGLFDEAFRLFFRDPFGADQAMAALLPRAPDEARAPEVTPRVAEALKPGASARAREQPQELVEIQTALDVSDREALRTKDFDAMTEAEIRRAKEAVARMRFFLDPVPIRRTRPAARSPRRYACCATSPARWAVTPRCSCAFCTCWSTSGSASSPSSSARASPT
jgi:uncharacterized protein